MGQATRIAGGTADVERFVKSACARLNAPLETEKTTAFRLLPQHLPQSLQERLAQENIEKTPDNRL